MNKNITYNFEEIKIKTIAKSRGPGVTIYKHAICFTKSSSHDLKRNNVERINCLIDMPNSAILFKKHLSPNVNQFNLSWSKNSEYATIRNKALSEEIRKRFGYTLKKNYLKSLSCIWDNERDGLITIFPSSYISNEGKE